MTKNRAVAVIAVAILVWAYVLTYIARQGMPHSWTESEIRQLAREEMAKQKAP